MAIWVCPNCNRNLDIDTNRKAYCTCGERYKPDMPTMPTRLWNFSYALYKHWLNGLPTCTEDDVQERLEICKACNLYTGTHCSHAECGCNVNGAVKFLNKLAWADQTCPLGLWDIVKPRWITTKQLTEDIFKLSQQLDGSITAIIGISRSGLIIGSQLASYLHLPLYSLDPFSGELVKCGSGYRLKDFKEKEGCKLIVDDSVHSYYTMREAKELVGGDFKTAAVYVVPAHIDKVDYYAKQLAAPHYFEWHFFNSYYNDDTSYDMDGVICEDFTDEEWRDPVRYLEALRTRKPKYVPRNKPITIVTYRKEQYRAETIKWLTTHGIVVKKLIMLLNEEDGPVAHKVRNIKTKIFVESDPEQARKIKELLPKVTVICPTSGEVL